MGPFFAVVQVAALAVDAEGIGFAPAAVGTVRVLPAPVRKAVHVETVATAGAEEQSGLQANRTRFHVVKQVIVSLLLPHSFRHFASFHRVTDTALPHHILAALLADTALVFPLLFLGWRSFVLAAGSTEEEEA